METPVATMLSSSRPSTFSVLVAPNATVIPVAPLLREILGNVDAVPALDVTGPFIVNVWPPGVFSPPPLVGNASVIPLENVAPAVIVTLPADAASPTVNVPAVNV